LPIASLSNSFAFKLLDSHIRTLRYSALEGVSKTHIGLNKVGIGATSPTMRNEVVTSLAEDRPIGSKAIFESAANVP
jgi:hypothetical protein